jgi:hypothetical protein
VERLIQETLNSKSKHGPFLIKEGTYRLSYQLACFYNDQDSAFKDFSDTRFSSSGCKLGKKKNDQMFRLKK